MSTEIEVRGAAVPSGRDMDAAAMYAERLAGSGLLPKQYFRQPANVLYAIEYGRMIGLAPMAAITGVHVIEGKPTASAALISALVRRAGHKLRVRGDARAATAQIVRSDDPDFVFEVTYTIENARGAKLLNKDVWQRYPASMLKARAITQCARDACEEALLGMHYTPEELGAEVDADGEPVVITPEQVAEAVERKAQRSRQADPDGEFAVGPAEPTDAEEIAPQDEELPPGEVERQAQREPWDDARPDRPSPTAGRGAPASQPQMRKLQAMMKGWSGDEKHGVLAAILGRPIASANELTLQDAMTAIDELGRRRDDLIARVRGQAEVGDEPQVRPHAAPVRVPGQAPGPQPEFTAEPSELAGMYYGAILEAASPRELAQVCALIGDRTGELDEPELGTLRTLAMWRQPQLASGPAEGASWSHQPLAGVA